MINTNIMIQLLATKLTILMARGSLMIIAINIINITITKISLRQIAIIENNLNLKG